MRRLVARTMAKALGTKFQDATAPYQHALTTRSGCESVAHVLQGLNREATVMSVDGVGAFDLISRSAMLTGLRDAPGCDSALPFVLQFYGRPSKYVWEDEQGEVHEVFQGEGGEQGDPLMPALFALGQHTALVAIQNHLLPTGCWLSWTICTWSPRLTTLPQSTFESKRNCGSTPGSGSTKGRPSCGTAVEHSLPGANTSSKPGGGRILL